MRLRHVIAVLGAAGSLVGCALTQWRSYGGPPLPRDQVAVLRTIKPSLGYGLYPVLKRFDASVLQRKDVWTKYYEIEMPPGEHELELEVTGNSGASTVVESEALTLSFVAEARGEYELRVGHGRSTFAERLGGEGRWVGWVADAKTGKVVSRVKPWPRSADVTL
jgi:hypothetical protein